MKIITLLTIAALFTCHLQTSAQLLTGFGIKQGVTFSNQTFNYPDGSKTSTDYVQGFNVSIFAEGLKNNLFNIYAETGYDQRGYSFTIVKYPGLISPAGEYRYKTHYIFLTLGAKLKHEGKYFTPYALLQPRFNVYLDYTEMIPKGNEDEVNYELRSFRNFVFDAGIGAGVEFNRLLPFKIFLEGNYFPALMASYSRSYVYVYEHSFNIKVGMNFIKENVR